MDIPPGAESTEARKPGTSLARMATTTGCGRAKLGEKIEKKGRKGKDYRVRVKD
jgi:hypothetical protein